MHVCLFVCIGMSKQQIMKLNPFSFVMLKSDFQDRPYLAVKADARISASLGSDWPRRGC